MRLTLRSSSRGAAAKMSAAMAGVEAGCRILRSETGTYVLSGTVEPADGTKVTVRGTKSDNVVSHCQQGEVIEVQSVTEVK